MNTVVVVNPTIITKIIIDRPKDVTGNISP